MFCWPPPPAPVAGDGDTATPRARRPESGALLDDFLSRMAGVEAEFHRAWTARNGEGRIA
ncbi:hypothetical protein GCM10009801_45750 [Streptomyces albiaxialis]|uniref:Uncharacterized protein n=1 Tax=Streptomyces albiaxialis TaxID=329523 RepID=A0ABN2W5U8_9ACTN